MTDHPQSLLEATRYFSDADRCESYMRKIRWQDGVPVCPRCAAKGQQIGEIKTRRLLKCRACKKQFSSRQGTVFESSKITLDKWFLATWLIANCKNGVSTYEIARDVGVTQPTAWFMLHRLRAAMEEVGGKFDGPAEADTTYIGGRASNMHEGRRAGIITGRGTVGKTIVHAIVQRGDKETQRPSQVRADVVGADDSARLLPIIRRQVRYGAAVYTDAAAAYGELCLTHAHQSVDHAARYVAGHVHTNGAENFFSLLKRTLGGTYIAVAPFHLFRYAAEQVFRFNERAKDDWHRFERVLRQIGGKRLKLRMLTAKDDAGFMGLQ